MRFFIIFFPLFLFSESFITDYEYGKMIYENTRGIPCIKCHGTIGEGFLITEYKHKNRDIFLKAPAINSIPFTKFKERVWGFNKKSVMPQYYLTLKEIEALYIYLRIRATED